MAGRTRDHLSDSTDERQRHHRRRPRNRPSSKHRNHSSSNKSSSRSSQYSGPSHNSDEQSESSSKEPTVQTTSTAQEEEQEDQFGMVVTTETARERMRKISTITDPADRDNPKFHIVATDTARERMRKISTITDPCEPEYGVVVTTETAHDRMRKMSKIGMEDPVDSIGKDKKEKNKASKAKTFTAQLRESEQQRRKEKSSSNAEPHRNSSTSSRSDKVPASPRVKASPGRSSGRRHHHSGGEHGSGGDGRHSRKSSDHGSRQSSSSRASPALTDDHPPSGRSTPTKDHHRDRRRNKSDSGGSRTRQRHRNHSDGHASKHSESEVSSNQQESQNNNASRQQQQPERERKSKNISCEDKAEEDKSLGDDMDKLFQKVNKEDMVGPLPTTKKPSDNGKGIPIGQMISAGDEQKQLMRKVSALGLEDPVFGNLHKDEMNVNHHASMIFEDMNLEDIPTDMRDMLSVASDHTATMRGINDRDILEAAPAAAAAVVEPPSFAGKKKNKGKPLKSRSGTDKSASTSQSRNSQARDDAFVVPVSFEPPRGSFVRRESKRMVSRDLSDPNLDLKPSSDKSLMKPTSDRSVGITTKELAVAQAEVGPPIGTFVRRESKRNIKLDSGSPPPTSPRPVKPKAKVGLESHAPPMSPRTPKQKLQAHTSSQRPTMTRSGTSTGDQFAPPTGSFRMRSPTKKKKHLVGQTPRSSAKKETLMESIRRTRKEENEDSLIHSALGQSMPDLGFGHDSFNNGDSQFDIRSNQSRQNKNSSKKQPRPLTTTKRQTSLRVVPHEEYKPPPAPSQLGSPAPSAVSSGGDSQVERRVLPTSMEFCFSPSGSHKKVITPPDAKPAGGRTHLLTKGESTRSWDGDLGIDDSPPTGLPPISSSSPRIGGGSGKK